MFDSIFGDLRWINDDDYCKTIKNIFLEVELDNMFFRETSQYEANDPYAGKIACKNIPVYAFRYLSAFNKFY